MYTNLPVSAIVRLLYMYVCIRAAYLVNAVYSCTQNYSYVRHFESCCTWTYIKYCLCNYPGGQEDKRCATLSLPAVYCLLHIFMKMFCCHYCNIFCNIEHFSFLNHYY